MAEEIAQISTLSDFGTFEVTTDDGNEYVIITRPLLGRVAIVSGGPENWRGRETELRRDIIAVDEIIEFLLPLPTSQTSIVTSINRLR